MKSFIKRAGWTDRVSGALISLCLAELALVGLTLWAVFDYRDAVANRGEARKMLLALDSALIAIVDAETGQRGYLITGEQRFLDPYRSGIARVDGALDDVSQLVEGGDGPGRQKFEELVPVVKAKQAELARILALRDDGVAGQVQQAVAEGEGKGLMDDIRARIAAMRADADQVVLEAQRKSDTLGNVLASSSVAVAVLTLGMVGALTFTLRRRVETESLQRAAVAKDEFVGFVSHELRGPIALIAGNARILAERSAESLSADDQGSIEEISRGAERLEATVATLLSLAQAESGGQLEVEPVLVHRVAAGAARYHRARYPGREVTVQSPAEVPAVSANRDAIEQVLLNLLQNAEKYGDPAAPVQIEVSHEAEKVTVRVMNEGPLLDPVQFGRVFEPFFRLPSSAATAEGVGLGLTVCHRLVSAQGGTMVAVALPSGGACFSFRLPIAPVDTGEAQG